MTQYLLGLDAGNTMTKVVLFDVEGREIMAVRRRNPILFPAPDHTERDPQAMWDDLCEAVRELLQEGNVSPESIAAVSVSGYGAGLYLVDAFGRAVRPGIMSTDSRVTQLLSEWEAAGLGDRSGQCTQQRLWNGQPRRVVLQRLLEGAALWRHFHRPDRRRYFRFGERRIG
jgi:L-xylulokinase